MERKMKVVMARVVDVGELLAEVEEELMNRDSFDLTKDYDRGMHDELRWIRNRLRSLPEVEAASPYDKTFGDGT